jgi:hypothetical protein
MGRRRPTVSRKEALPEYVRGAESRQTSTLATSPATLKAHEKRRGTPLIIPASVRMIGLFTLSVRDLMDLLIDTRYQREEITDEVSTLIHVLKAGGQIPDPISVVERKFDDHRRYIVDGQQRWWAHVDTAMPIKAIIYHVQSYEEEVTLFHAFNSQVRVRPARRLQSWPRDAGRIITALNEDSHSPLYQRVAFGTANPGHIPATPLMRGILALLSNTMGTGGLDRQLPIFDRYYKLMGKRADPWIQTYTWLVNEIFAKPKHMMHVISAIALGRLCYSAWVNEESPTDNVPDANQIRRFRALNWRALSPSASTRFLPSVLTAATAIWPVRIVETGES